MKSNIRSMKAINPAIIPIFLFDIKKSSIDVVDAVVDEPINKHCKVYKCIFSILLVRLFKFYLYYKDGLILSGIYTL